MRITIMFMSTLLATSVIASEVTVPNNFVGGEPALADDVNANFDALKAGVNDNHGRVSTLEGEMTAVEAVSADNQGKISVLESASSDSQGRISVLESSSTNGALDKALTGVVAMANSTNIVNGVGTLFTAELNVGDAILIEGETFTVNTITDDVELVTDVTRSSSGVVDVNIFSDSDLLTLKSGSGIDKAVVTKSGDLIRRSVRATGVGPGDGRNTGLITDRVLTFTKSKAETAIRVIYGDNFRMNGSNNSCRWEVLIDGLSCPGLNADPAVTDPLIYDLYSSSGNMHRSGTMFGFCEGLSPGVHTLAVSVGSTPGYSGADCYTGWTQSRWAIEVEEVY